jgi:hypothetical protein
MSHFSIAHEWNTNLERFWDVFFDDAFNDELSRRLKLKERTVLERSETDTTMVWVLRILPERDLPGFVKSLVKGDFGYVERNTYYKGKNTIETAIQPTLFADRTRIGGTFTLDVPGPGRVRRTWTGQIRVDVPLLGRKIEELIKSDMALSFGVAADVTREFLAKHPERRAP